ncbi:hypothetical protein CQJ94_16395 [Glycomyces fuscus]|nr:hypothetical protein CQJ94_16395 [Glycomyces fuscus]
MTATLTGAAAVAAAVADHLATPDQGRALAGDRWWPQSLAHGAAGVALLHIERARAAEGPWDRAREWLACAVSEGVDASVSSHLYYGLPAVAFVVHQAATMRPEYGRERDRLDAALARIVVRRLERAHTRIEAGWLPVLAEFDTIRGLAGLGALLLVRQDNRGLLELARRVLTYLVRLTEPVTADGQELPGWWTLVGPSGRESADFPGGHANTGMAHGIAGPLTTLAVALGRGIEVEDHAEAIKRILAWIDTWQQESRGEVWWPYWVTRAQLDGTQALVGPQRPSGCYGTSGLAHAQLLAASALGDTERQVRAHKVLTDTFSTAIAAGTVSDASLCHGYAGLALLAHTTGTGDASRLCAPIVNDNDPDATAYRLLTESGIGLLEGAASTAMALHSLTTTSPHWGWSAFLLTGHEESPLS